MWSRGERLPASRIWRGAALLGFLLLVLGNGGVVWAEQYVPSGLAAVIVASSPFWMAGVESSRADGERLTWRIAARLRPRLLGIVLLVWPDLTHGASARRPASSLGMISLQIACLGWSIGSSYLEAPRARRERAQRDGGADARRRRDDARLGTAHGEWRALAFTTRTAIAFVYLTTVGAIGGFVAYTYALRHLPVSLVSLYAYINPVIAVALGVAVLGEPFTWRMALAAALVFGGVAIVRRPGRGPQSAPHGEPRDGQTRRPLISRTRNSTIAMTSRT